MDLRAKAEEEKDEEKKVELDKQVNELDKEINEIKQRVEERK